MAQNPALPPVDSISADLSKSIKMSQLIPQSQTSDQYHITQPKFAALFDQQDFNQLKDSLVEINISDALSHLSNDGYLEVTLPVTGMTDLMGSQGMWQGLPQQFPTVAAINGYGAKSPDDSNHFPRPDFILATDIVGNQYEILVNVQGQVELPAEGTGLFSIVSALTLMYSPRQIENGEGLQTLTGAKSGMLYLLPPPENNKVFTPKIEVSHLDENYAREVDFVQQVPILFNVPGADLSLSVKTETAPSELGSFMKVSLYTDTMPNYQQPFRIDLNLEDPPVEIDLTELLNMTGPFSAAQGWQQNEAEPTLFSKQFGLSHSAQTLVVRDLYSERDFMQAMLAGEEFDVAHDTNYNNFMLRQEAIGPYYDLLVDSVIQHPSVADFIFEQVPNERIADLDLSYASVSQTDQAVLDSLSQELSHKNYSTFNKIFLPTLDESATTIEVDKLTLFLGDAEISELPAISATFIDPNLEGVVSKDLFEFDAQNNLLANEVNWAGLEGIVTESQQPDANHQPVQLTESNYLELTPEHAPVTLNYADLLNHPEGNIIKGFNLGSDKIDLSQLLDDNLPEIKPEQIHAQQIGEDVHLSVTDPEGQSQPLATLVGAAPSGSDPLDNLNQIIINTDNG